MSSIIELRKQELTTQINEMIRVTQYFIVNGKQDETAMSIWAQLYFENEFNSIKNTLQSIENGFNPESDSFATFEKCIDHLSELQREIQKIQIRGEAKQEDLAAESAKLAAERVKLAAEQALEGRRKKASRTMEGIFAPIGGVIGLVVGFVGCINANPSGRIESIWPCGLPFLFAVIGYLVGFALGNAAGRSSS